MRFVSPLTSPRRAAIACSQRAAMPSFVMRRSLASVVPGGAGRSSAKSMDLLLAAAPLVLAFLLFAAPAFAAIEGTITNGTTGRPAAGDEVVLLDLSEGMTEAAKTKADSSGHFKFDVESGSGMPHLVRANHQGVNYFKMVPPGTNSANLQVYDSARKVDGLAYNVEAAFQTDAGALQVVQFYVVRNTSSPPRTQRGEGLEIDLPDNASIQQSDVQAPGGQPIQTAANPKGKNRYTFEYPLRPGETTFRVMYTIPYSGEMTFKPTLLYPVDQFAIITPPGIMFQARNASLFSPQQHQGGINIQIANNVTASSDLSFRISGSGQMPDSSAQGGDQGGGGGNQTAQTGRPGGGLGTPIDTPDPLTKYKWPILLGLAVLLLFGGFYIVTQRQHAAAQAPTGISDAAEGHPAVAPDEPRVVAQDRSKLLLEAMKEELFQLEVDRQQGSISADEYAKARQALDATLKRALTRNKDARKAGA